MPKEGHTWSWPSEGHTCFSRKTTTRLSIPWALLAMLYVDDFLFFMLDMRRAVAHEQVVILRATSLATSNKRESTGGRGNAWPTHTYRTNLHQPYFSHIYILSSECYIILISRTV